MPESETTTPFVVQDICGSRFAPTDVPGCTAYHELHDK